MDVPTGGPKILSFLLGCHTVRSSTKLPFTFSTFQVCKTEKSETILLSHSFTFITQRL